MRDFPSYVLRKNHTQIKPNRIIYFDTETDQKEVDDQQYHTFKMGWSCYVQTRNDRDKDTEMWEFWEDPYSFCVYLNNKCKQKTTVTLIGHNIFYDLQVSKFFHYFTKWGWKLRFTYNKGLTYILVINKDKAVLKCLSTTNWFQTSLKNLGNMIGLEKLDVDFDQVGWNDLKVYCHRDVEIVKLAVEKYADFIAKNDMGNFAMTRAGQAWSAFRHRFMNVKIYIHRDEEISEFERKAYYGGRVEAFRIGKQRDGPFVSFDVNSLYPFVMMSYRYPTRLIDYQENPDPEMIRKAVNNRCVIAEVVLNTDIPVYPLRQHTKIIYPVGTFKTYLCTESLRYAFNHEHVVDIIKASYYEKDWIFQDYVNYFYELRQEFKRQGNREYEQFCKYLLNSLYGKFGQKTTLEDVWDDITFDGYYREEILDVVTGQRETITKLFNVCVSQWGEKTAKNAFVAIAAHVTDYGRFTLWKIIESLGQDKVLYCDTDSITIKEKDLKYLDYPISETELGALKKEHTYNRLHIYGAKDYETDISIKRKGVPKDAVMINDNTFRYTQWFKQDTHLRKQINKEFLTKTTTKTLKRIYDKAIVNKDGSTTPYNLTMSS